jgi:hypothetical protein
MGVWKGGEWYWLDAWVHGHRFREPLGTTDWRVARNVERKWRCGCQRNWLNNALPLKAFFKNTAPVSPYAKKGWQGRELAR